ncbi:hypothetical protein FPSE_06320 [Fusarium pseudograminearum CS3096]|uniref:Uncharacterized protein n=1 Tax=Fusarium pseudograminearum (strain CS3096) TaxID=1028729 RepID=K3VH41_FUSPC|nr:hypothetical protein FPSE_06320 [Fusarium pseudograminearum CS3096]EKJ73702.1 hypothetical protein FPSE_06320 [Fusarium pseudograminearum CS3096]
MAPQHKSRDSLTGLSFGIGIDRDIDEAEKEFSLIKGHIVTIKRGASSGEDMATELGYDSDQRNRITATLRNGTDVLKEIKSLQQDIRIAKSSVRQADSRSLAGLDHDDDEEARKRAASQVVRFLVESPDALTLASQMGQLPPAMIATIKDAQGLFLNDDLVSLRNQLDEANEKINVVEAKGRDCEREAQRAMQELRKAQEQHESNETALKRRIANADGQLHSNEQLAEGKLQKLKLDMQAEINRQKDRFDSCKAEKTTLERQTKDLEAQLQEAKRQNVNQSSKTADNLRAYKESIQKKRQVLTDLNVKINDLEKALINKDNTITRRDDVIYTRDQEIQSLNEAHSEQREKLAEKDRKIKELERASNDKDSNITQRDVLVKAREQEIRSLSETILKQNKTLGEKDRKIKDLEKASGHKDNKITKCDDIVNAREEEVKVLKIAISKHQTSLAEKDQKIKELEKASKEKGNTIIQHDGLVKAREEDVRMLNLAISKHQASLADKDRKIKELEKASNEKDDTIATRNGIIKTQVQEAATFLRHISEVESSSDLNHVAKEVLVDSTKASLAPAQWQPWKIHSWSDETSLKITPIDRSPEAIAIQILVALDGRSLEGVELLSLLYGLQTSLCNSSMVSSMIPMLLRAFTAVGTGVHFMHRLVMCQIANLLAPTDEALHQFTAALDNVDPQINSLPLLAFIDGLEEFSLLT